MKKSFLVLILLSIFSVFAENEYINDENIFFLPTEIGLKMKTNLMDFSLDEFRLFSDDDIEVYKGSKIVKILDFYCLCTKIEVDRDSFSGKVNKYCFSLDFNDFSIDDLIENLNCSFNNELKIELKENDTKSCYFINFGETEKLIGKIRIYKFQNNHFAKIVIYLK